MKLTAARVALITGGKGTLGRALAAHLAALGYSVAAPGRDVLDVSNAKSVETYFEQLSTIDLLINNAGAIEDALLSKMSAEQFAKIVEVNLSGAWRCAKAALTKMESGGHIIQVASHSAWDGKIGQANYAAAKAGLLALTQALAREVGSRGIRVNCISPGFLESKMTAHLSEQIRSKIADEHCLETRNTPEDVAQFIVCLDQMQGISGQIFHLDSRLIPWC